MKRFFCLLTALLLMLPLLPALAEPGVYNWYEVFVRSYQDSDGDGIGDLRGLISRLDYIQDMGYEGLWLMPVMPSPSYHIGSRIIAIIDAKIGVSRPATSPPHSPAFAEIQIMPTMPAIIPPRPNIVTIVPIKSRIALFR